MYIQIFILRTFVFIYSHWHRGLSKLDPHKWLSTRGILMINHQFWGGSLNFQRHQDTNSDFFSRRSSNPPFFPSRFPGFSVRFPSTGGGWSLDDLPGAPRGSWNSFVRCASASVARRRRSSSPCWTGGNGGSKHSLGPGFLWDFQGFWSFFFGEHTLWLCHVMSK